MGRLPVRHARGTPGGDRGGARVERHRWPADPRRLHPRRPRAVGVAGRPVAGLRGSRPRLARAQRLRLRPVHGRHRVPPGVAGARRHRRTDLGRHDHPPGPTDRRPAPRRAGLHPVVRDHARRSGPRGGRRRLLGAGRDLRGGAVERGTAQPARGAVAGQGARRLRAVGDHRPGSRDRVPRGAVRPTRQRGPHPR